MLQQRVGNHRLPALHARRGELRHQRVAIAVHDQTRQAVRLAMHQAHAVALDVKAATRLQGPRHCGAEKGGVNALRLVKTPNTCANLGAGAERRPAQKLALVPFYPHRLATVAAPALDGRFKDPGMAALQGALFAGAKA